MPVPPPLRPSLITTFWTQTDEGTENLYNIDVNAYQIIWRWVDGEMVLGKHTLLDDIDDVLADSKKARDYNTNEICSLRYDILEYFGAKKGSELPDYD